jgi:hypothetical protein
MPPPIGFLPCCCECKVCGDGLTPDYLTLTGAGFIDRVLNGSTDYPGRLISPLSAFNRAHQLDRVFAGRIVDRLPAWPYGPADACGVFYESAAYEFGDIFVSGSISDAEDNYTEESLWQRDQVYKLSIGLAVLDGVPLYFGGAADGSGGSIWIGGSILPGDLYYFPTIKGDVVISSPRLTRSLLCSTPSSAAMLDPSAFVQTKVYNPGTLPSWRHAHTGGGDGIYLPHYSYTDGDGPYYSYADPDDTGQGAATLSLIASAARS